METHFFYKTKYDLKIMEMPLTELFLSHLFNIRFDKKKKIIKILPLYLYLAGLQVPNIIFDIRIEILT